jgi:hypothetical protein
MSIAISVATTDPIYQSSLELDSEGGGEVYMVGNGEELPDKTTEEIQKEAEEEIAHPPIWLGKPTKERRKMA